MRWPIFHFAFQTSHARRHVAGRKRGTEMPRNATCDRSRIYFSLGDCLLWHWWCILIVTRVPHLVTNAVRILKDALYGFCATLLVVDCIMVALCKDGWVLPVLNWLERGRPCACTGTRSLEVCAVRGRGTYTCRLTCVSQNVQQYDTARACWVRGVERVLRKRV